MPFIQTAGLVTAGVLTATSLFAGVTSAGDDEPKDDPKGIPCGASWAQLPQDLRTDLADVRELPEGERWDALVTIRRDAVDGDYGHRVQQLAELRGKRLRALRQLVPADLTADLRAARGLEGEAQSEGLRGIRDGALAGEYGDRVQAIAGAVQQRLEGCETP